MDSELRLALCQMKLGWEDPQSNFNSVEGLLQGLKERWDLLILPEMFSTGFTMEPERLSTHVGEQTLKWMQRLSERTGKAVTGSTVFQTEQGFVNRLFFVSPEKDHVSFYDKRHLFTLAGEDHHYQAGNDLLVIDYMGFSICPLICYDLRFPVWSRNVSDYDLLIYVANWPAPRIQAWDLLLKARAIENISFCAGVNRIGTDQGGYEYPGHSTLVDPLGNSIVQLQGEGIETVTISKNQVLRTRRKLKFLDDRDHFVLLD